MQKLYCYVDETGQDTKGKLFLVAVIVLEKDQDLLRKGLEKIERLSKKGMRKWFHTNIARRQKYIEELIVSGIFQGSIFYSRYQDSKAYLDLTIFTVAKAIFCKARIPYETTIIVDGLNQLERHRFAGGLRRLNVTVRKVRGGREQSDALLRLVDAIAGFVRDAFEGDIKMMNLYKEGHERGLIKEI